MFKANPESIQIVLEHLPNAEALLSAATLNELLLPLDEYLTYIGFDENYELTELGNKLQRAYDDFYYSNP